MTVPVAELQEFANTRPALRGMDVARAFAALADYPRPPASEPVIPEATPTEIELISYHVCTGFIEQAASELGAHQRDFIRWPAVMEQLGEFSTEQLQQATGANIRTVWSALQRAIKNGTIERTGLASYRTNRIL